MNLVARIPEDHLWMYCSRCLEPINDRFYLKINSDIYHEYCASCFVCKQEFGQVCYEFHTDKGGYLLCHDDFIRIKFHSRCAGCHGEIRSSELVSKVSLSLLYHYSCMKCTQCGVLLRTGDRYTLIDNHLFCVAFCQPALLLSSPQQLPPTYHHHHHHPTSFLLKPPPPSSHTETPTCSFADFTSSFLKSLNSGLCPGSGGLKRPRTILNPSQRRKFKSAFDFNPKPSRKLRENLASETGLSVRVVQVWFQNQRAKEKKISKKLGSKCGKQDFSSCDQSLRSSTDNKSSGDLLDELVLEEEEEEEGDCDEKAASEPCTTTKTSASETKTSSSSLPHFSALTSVPKSQIDPLLFYTHPLNSYILLPDTREGSQ